MLQIRGRDLLCCEVCTLPANENANSSFKIFMSENYLRGTSPRKARVLVIAGAGCTVGHAYMSSPACIIPFFVLLYDAGVPGQDLSPWPHPVDDTLLEGAALPDLIPLLSSFSAAVTLNKSFPALFSDQSLASRVFLITPSPLFSACAHVSKVFANYPQLHGAVREVAPSHVLHSQLSPHADNKPDASALQI